MQSKTIRGSLNQEVQCPVQITSLFTTMSTCVRAYLTSHNVHLCACISRASGEPVGAECHRDGHHKGCSGKKGGDAQAAPSFSAILPGQAASTFHETCQAAEKASHLSNWHACKLPSKLPAAQGIVRYKEGQLRKLRSELESLAHGQKKDGP